MYMYQHVCRYSQMISQILQAEKTNKIKYNLFRLFQTICKEFLTDNLMVAKKI